MINHVRSSLFFQRSEIIELKTRLREVNEHGDIVGPARMRDHGWEAGVAVEGKAVVSRDFFDE